MAKQYVYYFGDGKAEGDAKMKWELGGKGANLAEMTNLGLPVPPGFTISTETCRLYLDNGSFPDGMMEQVKKALAKVEKSMGRQFGGAKPLLFSVRSGAPDSMPGMMDTILNLGLNKQTIDSFIRETGNPRFVYDSFRRLIQMFGDVVMEVDKEHFEHELTSLKKRKGVKLDTQLTADDLKKLIDRYLVVFKKHTGKEFPQDPWKQLEMAIIAVFKSWDNDRAIAYRRMNNVDENMRTASNVQAMVFGNLNENSATGVAFTQDPATGEDIFFGEYLVNAQGEDVVAGIRTPGQINHSRPTDQPTLEEVMPKIYKQLDDIRKTLDAHYRDMQDVEFTIQDGTLYMLQTRSGKRTAPAAIKIALNYLDKGKITEEEAISRIDTTFIDQLLHQQIAPKTKYKAIAGGLPAGPGAAVGQVVFDAVTAEAWANNKKKVILVRKETTPEDIKGMNASVGILTAFGGMTSHAALVARQMGKTCIVGCNDLTIDYKNRKADIKGNPIKEGDWITLAVGSKGEVVLGKLPTVDPDLSGDFERILKLADKHRTLKVRTNADKPKEAEKARAFGAEGIGLCRTEHMFFEEDRIPKVQRMILADSEEQRREALEFLLPLQQKDFEGIFTAMNGLPVTVRLIDPPLHEFVPNIADTAKIAEISKTMGVSVKKIKARIAELHEQNPMLGHRGCRLTITYPEIAEMQAAAIIGAACSCRKKGINAIPEIMVPLVGHVAELVYLKKVIIETAEKVMKKAGITVDYMVGTMIEVPRGAVTADEIAREAEFFSFGTNDLTQMTFGFSRDDIGKFLRDYLEKKILTKDPFQSIDQVGVGSLVQMACDKGRAVRPKIKLGVCGEHGGDPESIDFFHRVGLNYVSCSPFRVPIARLAAAQAAIKAKKLAAKK